MPKWIGQRPVRCDICSKDLDFVIEEFWIDGRTTAGPWAHMCPGCFALVGVGLGTGKGQMYDTKTLIKLEG